MKFFYCIILLFFILENVSAQQAIQLFYDEPATKWVEALPVGNGRLGAMVYGNVEQEHIQFNEETLWTGEPHDYSNKGAYKFLPVIRELLKEGKQKEAEDLATKEFMSTPLHQKAYQPFGDLLINFPAHCGYSNYKRILDIEKAICTINYTVEGVNYKREIFVSKPNDVLVVRISSDKPGALSFTSEIKSAHYQKSVQTELNQQILSVKVTNGKMWGMASYKVFTDGKINSKYESINVTDATTATIYLNAFTNFKNFKELNNNPERLTTKYLKQCERFNFDDVKSTHVDDYQSLYGRFTLNFGDNGKSNIPTNRRIYSFWDDPNDPQLIALYVQYARYLMISSSRPGGQPANLQGIWNKDLNPAWDSKWTCNINAEMNYWPVEITNLSECHQPLFDLIQECSESGSTVAKEHYNCNGWVLHHNTDIWRAAAPINASNHGIWVTGGAWLCDHIWEHFKFTQDTTFLAEKYPIIKGASLFFSEFLILDKKTGYLISSPSNSPEIGGLVAGPTMDHQIIRNLFAICSKASSILNRDKEFAAKIEKMIPQIAPNQIGRLGQLQEWLKDVDNPEVKHRHVSHLWGVYPGTEINWEETPNFMEAAKQSLIFRGDEGTGWSLGWKINFWSRFKDGNRTYKLIQMLLSPAEEPTRSIRGGSYPNLFDACPPFQIDGNFGGAAGIVEMLVQSHLNAIELLPALPAALSNGSINGVCARGGFELSFNWEGGELQKVNILSKAGKKCKLKYKNNLVEFDTEKDGTYVLNNKLMHIGRKR